VAHKVGGVSEAVRDGVTGLLVTPDRPAELAAAFEKLIHDEPLRRRLGVAGRVWAMRNRWEENASTLFAPAEDAG
jgi:glycosyltransferase involved in cell wall biosynthesis